MKTDLSQKIREVEDDHAAEIEQSHIATHDQMRRDQAMQFLGGAYAIDRLKEHLASQVIGALMTIEEQKLYLEFGYERFADFLDKSHLSGMSKTSYYRLRELYLKEGPEKYDMLMHWSIPLATRKLLDAGDIVVDGDEVVIGGSERVPLGDQKVIKSIIEKLVHEKRDAHDDLAKSESKIEDLKSKIDAGQSDYDELQRNLDAMRRHDPFDRAFGELVVSFAALHEQIGQMDDKRRAAVAADRLQLITSLYFRTSDCFGVKQPLASQSSSPVAANELDAKIAEIVSEAGPMNFEDEE